MKFFLFLISFSFILLHATDTPLSDKGCEFLKKKDYVNAKIMFEKAAKSGEAVAFNNLGLMYINGDGTKQNYAIAMLYFEKSLKSGYTNAAYDLGAMYKNGEGVKIDIQKAKEYYLIAAKNNYALAEFELAKIYGYEQNEQQFQFWATKALQNGYQPRTQTDQKIITYLHSRQ